MKHIRATTASESSSRAPAWLRRGSRLIAFARKTSSLRGTGRHWLASALALPKPVANHCENGVEHGACLVARSAPPGRRQPKARWMGAPRARQRCDKKDGLRRVLADNRLNLIPQQAPRGPAELARNSRWQGFLRLPASSADWLWSDLDHHVGAR